MRSTSKVKIIMMNNLESFYWNKVNQYESFAFFTVDLDNDRSFFG
jgi:hypothetical protein